MVSSTRTVSAGRSMLRQVLGDLFDEADDQLRYWAEPENLRLYLQTAGWKRAPAPVDGTNRTDVWVLPACTGGTYEVIVPSSRDTRDFDRVC